jgi:hypothetical protein
MIGSFILKYNSNTFILEIKTIDLSYKSIITIYNKLLFLIFEIFFLKKKELLAFFNARSSLTIRLQYLFS